MIFEYICPPASLYLAFSIVQILIDMFRGETTTAFLKFIVMIIFTIALNLLCSSGLGIISWFIVFIPFILMTYITTILVFVFGIPKTSELRPERKPRNEHDREWWREHERKNNNNVVGGCAGTRYGCCYDGETAKQDYHGSNCPPHPHHKDIGGCAGTQWGCCDDGKTEKTDTNGTNCHSVMDCKVSKYGCCDDGISPSPCPNGMTPLAAAAGASSSQNNIGGCGGTQFGCCSDKKTPATAKPCGYISNPVI